jgi:hypothetical protein
MTLFEKQTSMLKNDISIINERLALAETNNGS